MNAGTKRTLSLLAVAALAACQSYDAFQRGAAMSQLTEGEQRLWVQAQEADDAIRKSGQIYEDPALEAYLNGVAGRLFPDFRGRMRIHALKAPILNAFALPNGSIYANSGLIAAADNEAQLAIVLAHEGTHVVARHSARQRQTVIATSDVLFATHLIGFPVLTDLIAISSIYGYSRGLETEADEGGFKRYIAAGYAADQADAVFRKLLEQVEVLKIHQPFFFSDHPRLQARIADFKRLSATAPPGGEVGAERFLAAARGIRLYAVQYEAGSGDWAWLIHVLGGEHLPPGLPPETRYYLGEAYRQRGDKGDEAKAVAAYQRTIREVPDAAPSYRALGMLRMKGGDKTEAARLFERYLQLAPQAPDRGFVEQYLAELRKS